jgi:hypothetical protein
MMKISSGMRGLGGLGGQASSLVLGDVVRLDDPRPPTTSEEWRCCPSTSAPDRDGIVLWRSLSCGATGCPRLSGEHVALLTANPAQEDLIQLRLGSSVSGDVARPANVRSL